MTSKTTDNSLPDLDSQIKNSDIQIRKFIAALKKENKKLQDKIARLEAENVSLKNRIKSTVKVTEEELSKRINEWLSSKLSKQEEDFLEEICEERQRKKTKISN